MAIQRLPNSVAAEVVNVFWESFYDYPVFRHVLLHSGDRYPQHLAKLIGLFVNARVLRDDPVFGIVHDGVLVAAATTSVPDGAEPSAAFKAAREAVWQELGAEASSRYDQCVEAWKPVSVDRPQIHVNMIGVCRTYQRLGLASRLLDHVHMLSRMSPESEGVTLTTEDPRNVAFYERLGYQVVGNVSITPHMQTWGFFRPNER